MAVISLLLLEAKLLFAVLVRLSPLLPIPLVLILESWAVSKCEFSRGQLLVFRVGYVVSVFFAVCATFVLGVIAWE